MITNKFKLLACAGLLCAAQANAVSFVNGSFETGDLTGWTTDSAYGLNPFGTTYGVGMDGAYWAWLAGYETPITTGQTITGLIVGQSYKVDFIMASEASNSDSLTVTANGLNAQTFTAPPYIPGGFNGGFWDNWVSQQYIFTATSTAETINFSSVGLNQGGFDVGFDNVRISSSSVPDVGTTASLLGVALLGLGAVRRKLMA